MHWPLVNAPNQLTEQLGRQELELKRREDGAAFKARQLGFRCAVQHCWLCLPCQNL